MGEEVVAGEGELLLGIGVALVWLQVGEAGFGQAGFDLAWVKTRNSMSTGWPTHSVDVAVLRAEVVCEQEPATGCEDAVELAEESRLIGAGDVDDRVHRNEAVDRAIGIRQCEHRGDFESQLRKPGLGGFDHLRREVDAGHY